MQPADVTRLRVSSESTTRSDDDVRPVNFAQQPMQNASPGLRESKFIASLTIAIFNTHDVDRPAEVSSKYFRRRLHNTGPPRPEPSGIGSASPAGDTDHGVTQEDLEQDGQSEGHDD